MIKRVCLLIDDEKQDDNFPTIIEEGRKFNLDIQCYQFNVGNQERRDLLENEEISIDKVLSVFQEEFKGIKFDVIAFDWNIGSNLKGTELIKQFNDKNLRKNVAKILYSGALKEEVERICEDYKSGKTGFKLVWAEFNTLLTTNTLAFAGKDNYEKELVQQLRKVEDTFESTIEEELRKESSFIFKPSFPYASFQGKTFGELADIIEKDSTLRSQLTQEITQQVIAYLTERL